MKDNTILRIKVPARLYEAVKAQLTLDEAKGNSKYGAGMTPVKSQKATGDSSDKPKTKASKPSAPKAEKSAAPKAEVPAAEKKEVPKDGHKKAEKKPRSIEELKAAHRMIGEMIAEMEEGGKKPVEGQEERGAFTSGVKKAEELKNEDLTGYCYYVRSTGMSRTSGNTDNKTLYIVLKDNGGTCLVEDITEKDIADNKKISKTPDSLTIDKKKAIKNIAEYPALNEENGVYKNLVRRDLVATSV